MSRRWYIQPDPPTDAADGDIWEESDEYNTVVEFEPKDYK